MAIIAVVVILAVPSFSGFVKNSRIENESQELYAALNQTRQLAISSGRRAFLCRSTDVTTWTCLTGAGNDDWSDSKLIYTSGVGQNTGTPDANFANQAFQTIRTGLPAAEQRQILVSVIDEPPAALSVNADFEDNVVVFTSEGGILNDGILVIAICDDRTDPEDFGKYVEVNQTGRLNIRSTSAESGEINCDGEVSP